MPRYGHRSDPQMHVAGRRMMRVRRVDDGWLGTIFKPDVARAI